jgi:hypothetical protein
MERAWTAKVVASYDGEDGQKKTHSEALDVIGVLHAKIIFRELVRVQSIACVDIAIALAHG